MNYKSCLFNFSSSYMGGALKRIHAYLRWFNERGGASFILNYRLAKLAETFPVNQYYFLKPNVITKVFNHSYSFKKFITKIGPFDFYYSYGIPIPEKIARRNWLHIANVLPFVKATEYVSFRRAMEMKLLGYLLCNSMPYTDIISAESHSSLDLIRDKTSARKILSLNGSDDEIAAYPTSDMGIKENIAVAVGTCRYKCIDDVYRIYLNLRKTNPNLALMIAGIEKDVPTYIKNDRQVILKGILTQTEVCSLLRRARYYITATLIENSYNAASEGIFFATESFISDIGPHRELLENASYKIINELDIRIPSLHVTRDALSIANLKSWDTIIQDMISEIQPS